MATQWFDLFQVDEKRRAAARTYLEFLRVPALSTGLYVLPRGAADTQRPHGEDEVYFVLAGRAKLDVSGEVRPVQTGTVVYVERQVPHRFVEIEEELRVLVFFAPAEVPAP
jgi:mannose-6-phosphate isomerase-like protein (cupin superfamily)